MRLVTYRKGSSKAKVGALVEGAVLDLGALSVDLATERGAVRRGRGGFPKTMLALIQGGPEALAAAREALEHGLALLKRDGASGLLERRLGVPADKARLEAPIPRPARNVFCLGRNYKEHAAERGAEAPAHPVYFTKAPETVVGPGAKVSTTRRPRSSTTSLSDGGHRHRVQGLARRRAEARLANDHQRRHRARSAEAPRTVVQGKSRHLLPMWPGSSPPTDPDLTLTVAMRITGRPSSAHTRLYLPVERVHRGLSQGFTILPGDVIATARRSWWGPPSASPQEG